MILACIQDAIVSIRLVLILTTLSFGKSDVGSRRNYHQHNSKIVPIAWNAGNIESENNSQTEER